jgi:HK97 family phage major capsid protein
MNIDFVSLNEHLTEYNVLSNKAKHSAEESRRMAYLQTAISALKAGASMEQVDEARTKGIATKYGLQVEKKSTDREIEARGWHALATENRDMGEGNPISRIGSYTGLGYFVPTEFFPQVSSAMAKVDALFDENSVTLIRSSNGRPITVPVLGDIENVATIVGEAGSQTSTDIASTGQGVLGAYSYKTPRMVFSIESFQDIDSAIGNISLFKQVTASRLARGIAKHFVAGDGSAKPLGLVASLEAVGVPSVVASGCSANTGGAETGANSLGSADFAAALTNIDQAYLDSPKAAWFMNRKTLTTVASIINKYGDNLNLVQYVNGQPFIYGIPVKICPSMDNIGVSAVPVVLGDGTFFATRLVQDENSGIRVYSEASGLVEYGNIGMSAFMRADCDLLYTDTNSPAPFTYIRNHS